MRDYRTHRPGTYQEMISGFRWSFYEIADVSVALSFGMTLGFLTICMLLVWWIFRTGYRLKN